MKHYLITMFNLRLTWGGVDYASDSSYLTTRFDLFEKYTFPSVKNQTNQNFEWLVLFSESTPQKFKDKIEEYTGVMKNFVPLYIADKDAPQFRQVICKYIMVNTKDECIVTSRCDNDDVLSKHFIEKVQANVRTDEGEYIVSFPNGYQYDEKSKILRKYYFPTSHFTTLVTQNAQKSIYDFLHMEILDKCNVKMVEQEPLWIEVIHAGNVYNCMGTVDFRKYVKSYNLQDEFTVALSGNCSEVHLICMYLYFAIHKLYVKRDRILAVIKRKLHQHKK